MLAKKRIKEEEGLHDDETLLEYQNRCLINKVREQNEEIKGLKTQIETVKTQSTCLSKIFMEVNCRLLSMVDSLEILMCEMQVEKEKTDVNLTSPVFIGLSLLENLKGGFSNKESLAEQHASILENIKNNIESIVAKVVSGCSSQENKNSSMNFSLKDKLNELSKEVNSKTVELSLIKNEKIDYSAIIKEKDKEITELKNKVNSLNRKSTCNPLVPYIKYSKEIFESIETEHSCVCHVCGVDFESKQNDEEKIQNLGNHGGYNLYHQQGNQGQLNQNSFHSISLSHPHVHGHPHQTVNYYNEQNPGLGHSGHSSHSGHNQVIIRGNSSIESEHINVSQEFFNKFFLFRRQFIMLEI